MFPGSCRPPGSAGDHGGLDPRFSNASVEAPVRKVACYDDFVSTYVGGRTGVAAVLFKEGCAEAPESIYTYGAIPGASGAYRALKTHPVGDLEDFPELLGWCWPSSRLTAAQVTHAVHMAIGQTKPDYPMPEPASCAIRWQPVDVLSDGAASYSALLARCRTLAQKIRLAKNPGYPLGQLYARNDQALAVMGHSICDRAVRMVLLWMEHDWSVADPPTGWDALSRGYTEVVTPFIKSEPHPARKAIRGAWRTVNSVALAFQLAERIILGGYMEMVKSCYGRIPATVGIGFTPEMGAEFAERLRAEAPPNSSAHSEDISGWDRSVSAGDVAWAARVASAGIVGAGFTKLQNALRVHAWYMSRPLIRLWDGSAWQLCHTTPGCMLSGSTLTATYNSMIRWGKARMTGAITARCVGDDALTIRPSTQTVAEYEQLYRDMGLAARESTLEAFDAPTMTAFSLCSHRYEKTDSGWRLYLVSAPRTIFRALTRQQTPDSLDAVLRELVGHPRYDDYAALLRRNVVMAKCAPVEAHG